MNRAADEAGAVSIYRFRVTGTREWSFHSRANGGAEQIDLVPP